MQVCDTYFLLYLYQDDEWGNIKLKNVSRHHLWHFILIFLSQIDVFLIYIGDDSSYDGLC